MLRLLTLVLAQGVHLWGVDFGLEKNPSPMQFTSSLGTKATPSLRLPQHFNELYRRSNRTNMREL